MTVGFSNMKIDGMFSYRRLELSSFAYLLGSAITYRLIQYAEVGDELLQYLTGTALVLHQIGGGKEQLVTTRAFLPERSPDVKAVQCMTSHTHLIP